MKLLSVVVVLLLVILSSIGVSAAGSRVYISEIYYSDLDESKDFIELYVNETPTNESIDLTGWYLTTFDGDIILLPNITGIGNFDYISIFMGSGINDANANDGNASIYLNITSVLDNNDEVGLYDPTSQLADFVRYNGGNGDPVMQNWQPSDLGANVINPYHSLQIHSEDMDNSSDWHPAEPSPSNPNILEFYTGTGLLYQIHNGVNYPVNLSGGPWEPPGYDIHPEGGPLTAGETDQLKEYLTYTFNYMNDKGMGTPETGADNDVDVHITKNGGMGGNADDGNRMDADINNNIEGNFAHRVMAKRVVEHEQVHLIQYKNSGGGWGPMGDWSDLEGMAEYWSVKITMQEFNITYQNYTDIYVGLGFSDPFGWLRKTDRNFYEGFEQDWDYYWANHMFLQWIEGIFGEDKVKHIFKVRNVTSGVVGMKKTVEKAMQEQGHNITFEQLFTNYTTFLYKNYSSKIKLSFNDTFTGGDVDESGFLQPWGTDYERYEIKTKDTFNIHFQGNGKKYVITVIKRRSGGSEEIETYEGTDINILISNDYDEIILIKRQIGEDMGSMYNVSLRKVNDGSTIDNSTIKDSAVSNSSITNADVKNSSISGSSVDSSNASGSNITRSDIKESSVSGSKIDNSTVRNSTLINCTVINSNIKDSTKINSIIINSVNIRSRAANTIENGSTVVKSGINDSTIKDSAINDSSVRNSSLINDTIINSTMYNIAFSNFLVINDIFYGANILPGSDLFETGSAHWDFISNPIPPDFFDPGSQPFDGIINLKGSPISPLDLGSTDTIIERLEPIDLLPPSTSDTISIEINSLSLVSVSPITVRYGAGEELWNVQVNLSPSQAPLGQMTATKEHANGGTFQSNFFVQPVFVFTRQGDNAVRVLDTAPPAQLQTNNVPWRFECPTLLHVEGLTSNFCPGFDGDRVIIKQAGPDAELNLLSVPDCNSNSIPDNVDIMGATSNDCNSNGIPDECDVNSGTGPDCNVNGIPDECDIDSDSDKIPDDCDTCPGNYNPDQINTDGDGAGDICDPCPAKATDDCDTTRSGSQVIGPAGGYFEIPGWAALSINPNTVTKDTSFSITEYGGNFVITSYRGLEKVIYSYYFGPDTTFYNFVDMFIHYYNGFNPVQEASMTVFHQNKQSGVWDEAYSVCGAVAFGNKDCYVPTWHFSQFAIAVPLDSDNDTIFDNNTGIIDNCPYDYNLDQSDADNNSIGDACEPGSFNLSLKQGWNLVSIPLKPANSSVSYIFNNFNKIFSFEADSKKYSVPQYINASKGYWIKMDNDTNITITGEMINQMNTSLDIGWNLIGYPEINKANISSYLKNISKAYSYNGSWSSYFPDKTFNSLETLEPGYGYWVNVG